jgi:hypothetical protein
LNPSLDTGIQMTEAAAPLPAAPVLWSEPTHSTGFNLRSLASQLPELHGGQPRQIQRRKPPAPRADQRTGDLKDPVARFLHRFAPEPSLYSHDSCIIRASSTADMHYSTRDDGNAVTSILHKVNMGDGNMATSTHKVSVPRHLQQYHVVSSVVRHPQSFAALAKHGGALQRASSRHPQRSVSRSRTDPRQQAARPTRYSATCASSSYSPLMAPANHYFSRSIFDSGRRSPTPDSIPPEGMAPSGLLEFGPRGIAY